jgi:hypothetical protein
MGTTTIDGLGSLDIIRLQNDISELLVKLNSLIIEFNKSSSDMSTNKIMIDSLKVDVEGLNAKISGNYTAASGSGGGSSADSILKRLHDLDSDFSVLDGVVQAHIQSVGVLVPVMVPGGVNGIIRESPHSGSGYTSGRTGGTPGVLDDISGSTTLTSGNAADTSSSATSASVNGAYSGGNVSVMTLGGGAEKKARALARKTLNRLRK